MLFQIEAFWSQKTRQIVTMCLIWEPCRGGCQNNTPPVADDIFFSIDRMMMIFLSNESSSYLRLYRCLMLGMLLFFRKFRNIFKKVAADLITTNISWIYPKYENTIIHLENVFLGLAWNDTVSKTSITALSP